MPFRTEAEYNSKRDEVLSKFKEEFYLNYYNYDPQFREIVEMLIRDADPYAIIEALIIDRKKLLEQAIELAMYSTKPLIYPEGVTVIKG